MDVRVVSVGFTDREYDIFIGAGLLSRLADFLPFDFTRARTAFVITDVNATSYAHTVQGVLQEAGIAAVNLFTLPAGEETKCFAQVERLTSWLLSNGVRRGSTLFAVGGGVVGDVVGFTASIVLRGVPFIQIPTTLLSQVDSSIGGKTGINTAQGKNLVGTFYQPSAVVIDTDTLSTLPRREVLAGYAEILKHALIGDYGFFVWLEENGQTVCDRDPEIIAKAIETSCRFKAKIVEADEREAADGPRALLNFGHTFGHALEVACGYTGHLLHGEAVAIGMAIAMDVSVRLGLCPAGDRERAEDHMRSLGLLTRAADIIGLKASVEDFMVLMQMDKKASAKGVLRFVLSHGIGMASVREGVPEDALRAAWAASL